MLRGTSGSDSLDRDGFEDDGRRNPSAIVCEESPVIASASKDCSLWPESKIVHKLPERFAPAWFDFHVKVGGELKHSAPRSTTGARVCDVSGSIRCQCVFL